VSTVNVPTQGLLTLCINFFDQENKRVAEDHEKYKEQLCTKRRLFGLLKPKYTKEEVDKWETPTIYDSMMFQTMFPHHKIAELRLSAELADKEGIENILVDCSVFNHLDGTYKGWGR